MSLLFIMSDSEISSNDSPQRSDIPLDSDASDSQDYLVVGASYAPYQGEPLAKKNTHSVSDEPIDEEGDEDGILPSVLEQRFKGEIPVHNW